MDALEALLPKGADAIVWNAANLFAGLYSSIVAVVDIWYSNNQLSTDEFSLVLPHSLSTIHPAKVTKLIRGELVVGVPDINNGHNTGIKPSE